MIPGPIVGAAVLAIQIAAVDVPADLTLTIDAPITAAIAAHRLEPPFDRAARTYASTYVYTVICRGVGVADGFRAAEVVMQANPSVPYQAAVLEILGIYVRAMPNGVNSAVCAKAFENATAK